MERDNHLRPEQPRNMEMLHVWTTHGEKGFRISSKILSSLCRFSIVNANDKSIRGQSPSLSPSLSTNKAIQKVEILAEHRTSPNTPDGSTYQEYEICQTTKWTLLERTGNLQKEQIQPVEMSHVLQNYGEKGPTPKCCTLPGVLHHLHRRQLHRRRWR